MLYSSLIAFLHFIFAFGVAFAIIFERILYKQKLDYDRANLLRKVDSFYGLSAIMVLIIGFIRVFYFEKGSDFYFGNPFFHLKLTLFVIIGLLSIYPTIIFLKWRKLNESDFPLELSEKSSTRIERILNAEVVLVILLILSASLMAKAITI